MARSKCWDGAKTLKVKLIVTSEQEAALAATCKAYQKGCALVSGAFFELCEPRFSAYEMHETMYDKIRRDTGLKSQIACSVFRTVAGNYKTILEQMKKHPFVFVDSTGKKTTVKKDLTWLRKPVEYTSAFIDEVYGHDWSFTKDGMISFNTLEAKRTICKWQCPKLARYLPSGKSDWTFGTSRIQKIKGSWYFLLHYRQGDIAEPERKQFKQAVGIDRGINYVVYCLDDRGKEFSVSGKDLMKKRHKKAKQRQKLQKKGTKSAKRVLRRLSKRENGWMRDVNHRLSKALVERYGPDTLFVLEDLGDASFAEKSRCKEANFKKSNWAFFQLGEFLKYKALEAGSKVIEVQPAFTSQRCPVCGRIHKENRDHNKHEYICDVCGFHQNDDLNGAHNIMILGQRWLDGEEKPSFFAEKKARDKAEAKKAKTKKKEAIPELPF